jgi:hypothetical protein
VQRSYGPQIPLCKALSQVPHPSKVTLMISCAQRLCLQTRPRLHRRMRAKMPMILMSVMATAARMRGGAMRAGANLTEHAMPVVARVLMSVGVAWTHSPVGQLTQWRLESRERISVLVGKTGLLSVLRQTRRIFMNVQPSTCTFLRTALRVQRTPTRLRGA